MSPDSPASPFDKRPVSRPPFAVLDIEYNELVQAWNRLHGVLPPENQVPFHHPPNDSDLLPVVRAVQTSWMSSPHQPLFTRSSSLCDHFLSSVNTHSSLLSTLPDCDAYRALFYAAIQSVIKVIGILSSTILYINRLGLRRFPQNSRRSGQSAGRHQQCHPPA